MGLHRVLSMLVFAFSTCRKVHVNTAINSPSNCSHDRDPLPYTTFTAVTTRSPLPLTTYDGQLTTRLPLMGHHLNTDNYPAGSEAVNARPRRMEMQRKFVKVLEKQRTREISMFPRDTDSLRQMLVAVAKQELRECNLVLAYDTGYSGQQAVLEELLQLPNLRQVVNINATDDLLSIMWESTMCRGYLFLLDTPESLLNYANIYHHTWDYSGRYILVAPLLEQLEAFVSTKNGKKTEHIVGVVKSSSEGEWMLYMNQLYWGQGVRRINTWRHHRFTHQLDLFPDKLADLQGAVLKVSTFMFEPCIFYRRAPNGSIVSRYGVDIEVTKAVAYLLNFTAKFEEPPDRKTWGSKLENGSWYGMVGQLERNEVDIGVANLYVSSFQTEVLDFSAPYTSEMTCFMTRTEPPLPRWQALAFPFHIRMWLAILAGLTVSGPLLFFVAWCSSRCGGEEIRSLQSLSFSWYYAFGMHFCEAHVSLPRMASTQILVMFLWLYTMILTIAYSSNLRAFLIVRKPPAMMETIKEVYESGLQVAADGTIYKAGIAASSDPYLQGLTKVYKGYDFQEEAFPLVLEGKAVFLGNRVTLEFLVSKFTIQGIPRMRIMKENFASYTIAMALQRHSPLKRKVDMVLGWIRQSGLVRYYFVDSLRQAAAYEKDGDDEGDADGGGGGSDQLVVADGVIPLGLDHMQGILLVTVIGWIFSAQAFLLEKTIMSG
ncbi:ionotropic receptor 21a-like [Panulirus ornatus]|uniref:ionotropic receptor 21a-like n=1 Tax=Panulirus ornatus TaxID=150431 RepID=UPI003A87F558